MVSIVLVIEEIDLASHQNFYTSLEIWGNETGVQGVAKDNVLPLSIIAGESFASRAREKYLNIGEFLGLPFDGEGGMSFGIDKRPRT